MSASEQVPYVSLLAATDGTAANGAGPSIPMPRNNVNTIRRALCGWTTSGTVPTAKVQGGLASSGPWQDAVGSITLSVSPNVTTALYFDAVFPYLRTVVAGADSTTVGVQVVVA